MFLQHLLNYRSQWLKLGPGSCRGASAGEIAELIEKIRPQTTRIQPTANDDECIDPLPQAVGTIINSDNQRRDLFFFAKICFYPRETGW